MQRRRMLLGGVLITALLAGGVLFGEQQPSSKSKGKLPRFWSKLGLSDEQRKRVASIQTEYKVKIDALKAEISKLDEDERRELGKILTDVQREELKKIIASQALSDTPSEPSRPKADKAKGEKKPGDK
jgi:hypothetical protein